MAPKLPLISGKDAVKAFTRAGWHSAVNELSPQSHRAHGELTEDSTLYYPLDTARDLNFHIFIMPFI